MLWIQYQKHYSHYIFFVTYEGPNRFECLSLASLFYQACCNTKNYYAHLLVTKKITRWEYGTRSQIPTSFSLWFKNGPNKFECLSLASFFYQVLCNTLDYCVHLLVKKKMKCWEYSTRSHNHTLFSLWLENGPINTECLSLASFFNQVCCNTLDYI
jgi:hypothetical protein